VFLLCKQSPKEEGGWGLSRQSRMGKGARWSPKNGGIWWSRGREEPKWSSQVDTPSWNDGISGWRQSWGILMAMWRVKT